VLPIVTRLVGESDIIIGGRRNLDIFNLDSRRKMIIQSNLKEIVDFIKEHREQYKISVLVSGDPGFYSMLNYLLRHFDQQELEVIPGISSTQYLISRMKTCWQDAVLTSLHGRMDKDFLNTVRNHKKVILLTDNQYSPDKIARHLLEQGFLHKKITVGENLSYDDERIVEGSLQEIAEMRNFEMSVMVIEDE
jgi:cobalt-precorrin-7 (C5)-methyltransferase